MKEFLLVALFLILKAIGLVIMGALLAIGFAFGAGIVTSVKESFKRVQRQRKEKQNDPAAESSAGNA
ncbi:MAG: hypothetical protein DRN26_05695 [Thermoplasmata archaeon]|nr:MAG: hypothetical protein DRN26_05695 [Thermoplasmata archaeon]